MKIKSGLDLVRFLAVLFVPAVHFFLNNGFYYNKINGKGYFVSLVFLMLFYIGVPLFLLLSGYLKRKKVLSKDYYKGIIKIIVSYLFIAIICTLVRKFVLHDDIRILSTIINVFNFKACGYAWYVEMYIGLFLFIPFLNILYNGLDTKKNKQMLILTLIVACSFYPIINYIKIDGVYLDIVPDFWTALYPFIYYFIGCYISEYQVKFDKRKLSVLALTIIVFEAVVMYHYHFNQIFSWTFFWTYNSVFVILLSTIVFLLFYDVDIKNKLISKFVTSVSVMSLDIYLFSYLVDRFTYQYFNVYLKTPVEYLYYMIPIVLFVCVISYLMAYVKKIVFLIIGKIFPKCKVYL